TCVRRGGGRYVSGIGGAPAACGVAQKTVTGATAGPVTVTASATGLTAGGATFSVTPGPATQVGFTSTNTGVACGGTKTLTAEIRDANNNVEASDNATVVTLAQTNGGGSLTELGGATASAGVAQKVVTGVTEGSVTVSASATGLTSGTTTFSVTPGTATQVVITS